jgi:hypothetical protein
VSARLVEIPGTRIGMRYLFTSQGFWIVFNLGMLVWWQHFERFYFREPAILALTHLAALGWLSTGLMGVMYATLPATLGVRPNSLRMAHVQYWLQVVGIVGLVLSMSIPSQARWRVVFGLLTLGALVIFVHNMATTVGRGKAWHVPEAHFVMAVFYLAITGFIGVSYVFYLNSGYVPQAMTHVKVHAHFAGLGWLALTLMGLTYKLLPLELGAEHVSQRWGLAASVLINVVFWGVFFSYAYDWPGLRTTSAGLGLAAVVCHALQVRAIAQRAPNLARHQGRFLTTLWSRPMLSPSMEKGKNEALSSSFPYIQASCLFGFVTALLAIWLTTGASGDSIAVEYAYGYAAGAGWFGLSVTGQTVWLIPLLLHDDAPERVHERSWQDMQCLAQVIGTALVTSGLLAGVSWLVAAGAAVNVVASVWVMAGSVRLCRAQPAMAER